MGQTNACAHCEDRLGRDYHVSIVGCQYALYVTDSALLFAQHDALYSRIEIVSLLCLCRQVDLRASEEETCERLIRDSIDGVWVG